MKKAKIIIASVLKPFTDSRAFGKFAISLRETNKYHINIIGFSEKKTPKVDNIEFTSIFHNHRLHPGRLLAPFKLAFYLLKHKPRLLIVTTYELLFTAAVMKRALKYKLVYDLQENYSRNIHYNKTLSPAFRSIAAKYVQFVEKITGPSIDHYFLAEQCYQNEFPRITNFTLLENKYSGKLIHRPSFDLSSKTGFKFIITGTITPVYGVEDGIGWFEYIRQLYPGSSLEIIGHVPLRDYTKKLQSYSKRIPDLILHISERPIAQKEIYAHMLGADLLLLPYQNLPSISDKIPTKLYEALAMGIPMIIPENPMWEKLVYHYPAGTSLDFLSPEKSLPKFEQFINQKLFKIPVGEEVSWTSEERKFLGLIGHLVG